MVYCCHSDTSVVLVGAVAASRLSKGCETLLSMYFQHSETSGKGARSDPRLTGQTAGTPAAALDALAVTSALRGHRHTKHHF
jgi:hypothetical protein